MRTILLLAVAAALAGCTISTELGPGGFQGGRYSDGSNTGSKLTPIPEGEQGAARKPGEGDKGQGTPGKAPAAAKN